MSLFARRSGWLKIFCWLSICLVAGPVFAQPDRQAGPRVVNPGDSLVLAVPGHPEYDLSLQVEADGMVLIPGIGSIRVAGLTESEAVQVMRQRLRLFDPTINDISLSLTRAGGIQIFVIGSVVNPGPYQFMTQPSLWDLLRAAGGAAENANLAEARIIRETATGTEVQIVDLNRVLSGGRAPQSDIQDGDTLVIPTLVEGISTVVSSHGVQVFGGVAVPTVVNINEPTPLMDVLMRAGAPVADADLEAVWWVHQTGQREYLSTKINVRSFLEMGDVSSNPLIYPGDSLEVTLDRPSWLQQNLPLILGVIATTATVVLAWDRVARDR